jgi:hypothetical protein
MLSSQSSSWLGCWGQTVEDFDFDGSERGLGRRFRRGAAAHCYPGE